MQPRTLVAVVLALLSLVVVIATLAAREGRQLLNDNPSLVNDALIAVSCRERGITLITRDGDFKRLSPLVRGFRYVAPWPSSVLPLSK